MFFFSLSDVWMTKNKYQPEEKTTKPNVIDFHVWAIEETHHGYWQTFSTVVMKPQHVDAVTPDTPTNIQYVLITVLIIIIIIIIITSVCSFCSASLGLRGRQ